MSSVIFTNGQRIIAAIFQWLQTSEQTKVNNLITDTFSSGIDNATTAGEGFLVVPGNNNTSLTPSVNVTLGGIAYDAVGNRIYISPSDTTLYNPANSTATTNDGLGNFLATPQSSGVVNIPLTQGSQNYIWIDYLPTINTAAFTTNEITNAKIFFEQTDGYNIRVTTTNVPPDANSIFLASVNMTGGGAVASSNISQVGRQYYAILPKIVPIITPLADLSDRTPSYPPATRLVLEDHIKAVGTGPGISPFNPHNTSLADLGVSTLDTVVGRSQIEGNNNVIITTNPNPVASAMASYINYVLPFGSDTLTIYALSSYGGIAEYAIVNGSAYSATDIFGALLSVTVTFPNATGVYNVYWNSSTHTFGVTTADISSNPVYLWLATVTYTYVGSPVSNNNPLTDLIDRRLIGGTNSLLQRWTTVARPANPVVGEFGFNTTLGVFEFWDGTAWQQVVEASANGTVPSGAMLDFAGSTAPTGYLLCDGSLYATATYPTLFSAIGYAWGGAGASFNVPDFRRRTAVGSGGAGTGTLGNTVGKTGGAENVTPTQLPHTHTENPHYHNQASIGGVSFVNISTNVGIYDISGNPPSPGSFMGATNNAGGNPAYRLGAGTGIQSDPGMSSTTAINNPSSVIQPSAVVTKIIKY
jgi:microcystin-dependent protein